MTLEAAGRHHTHFKSKSADKRLCDLSVDFTARDKSGNRNAYWASGLSVAGGASARLHDGETDIFATRTDPFRPISVSMETTYMFREKKANETRLQSRMF